MSFENGLGWWIDEIWKRRYRDKNKIYSIYNDRKYKKESQLAFLADFLTKLYRISENASKWRR